MYEQYSKCSLFCSWGFIIHVGLILLTYISYVILYEVLGEEKYWSVIIIHQMFALFAFVSLLSTIWTDPGLVTDEMVFDGPRYCLICRRRKPERSHHCSLCRRCVRALHYHDECFANCIGLYNRKSHFLYLTYALITILIQTFMAGFTIIEEIVNNFENQSQNSTVRIMKLIVFCFDLLAGIILVLLVRHHLILILENQTVYEYFMNQVNERERERSIVYDVGVCQNFKQVMGGKWYLWPIPFLFEDTMRIDGLYWPKNL